MKSSGKSKDAPSSIGEAVTDEAQLALEEFAKFLEPPGQGLLQLDDITNDIRGLSHTNISWHTPQSLFV